MDASLFHLINTGCSNSVFDVFFPWYTNFFRSPQFWMFAFPVVVVIAFWAARSMGVLALAVGGLLSRVADWIGATFVKPFFLRPRPFMTLPDAIVRIPRPGGFSFPSSHSLDAFFLATFFALVFPRGRYVFFALAFLMAFSRVYCGAHYPGDVCAGACLGAVLAWCAWLLYSFVLRQIARRRGRLT